MTRPTDPITKQALPADQDPQPPVDLQADNAEEPRSPRPTFTESDQPLPQRDFGLTRQDQRVVAGFVAIILSLSVWNWARLSGWGLEPVEIERLSENEFTYRLDPNTATWVELMHVEGIGEMLARRIVEHREEHGPFESIDDLQEVKGIGAKTLQKLRPWLRISPAGESANYDERKPEPNDR